MALLFYIRQIAEVPNDHQEGACHSSLVLYADEHGYIWVMPPKEQKGGDYCTFQAEQDCVIAMSACPWGTNYCLV